MANTPFLICFFINPLYRVGGLNPLFQTFCRDYSEGYYPSNYAGDNVFGAATIASSAARHYLAVAGANILYVNVLENVNLFRVGIRDLKIVVADGLDPTEKISIIYPAYSDRFPDTDIVKIFLDLFDSFKIFRGIGLRLGLGQCRARIPDQ